MALLKLTQSYQKKLPQPTKSSQIYQKPPETYLKLPEHEKTTKNNQNPSKIHKNYQNLSHPTRNYQHLLKHTET